MAHPASRIRRGPGERLEAWVFTGPLGHFWSAAADVTILWVRYGLSKLAKRRR